MVTKIYRFFNRPISPHLTIYKLQQSSSLSILHRFTGIFLTLFFIIFLLTNDLLKSLTFYPGLIYLLTFSFNFTIQIIFWFWFVNFIYHWLNGMRFVLMNFGFFLQIYYLKLFVKIIIFVYFIIILFILCF